MTDKELKRLSRAELLEMLLARTEENEKLKTRLKEAEAALSNRRIDIEKSGSMAEAALRLNHIFEAADAKMADDRSTSVDSRSSAIGCIADEDIIGRIIFKIWPLSEIGAVR